MSKKYILYCLSFFMILASKTFSNETIHPDSNSTLDSSSQLSASNLQSELIDSEPKSKFGQVPDSQFQEIPDSTPQLSEPDRASNQIVKISEPVEISETQEISDSGRKEDSDLASVSGEEESGLISDENQDNLEDENGSALITEEKLKEIIEQAKNAPLPQESVEVKNRDAIFTKKNSFKTNVEIVDEFKDTLDKYNFSNKSNDVHVGRINANEFTSDQLINNSEVGVGISYKEQNDKYKDRATGDGEDWNYTPIYATGKYKISEGEDNTKYLKVNLGYSFKEVSKEERKDSDDRVQGGIYYGIGGGVDFRDMSVGVMYQVNKDSKEDRNTHKDDSRVTFSVDYKLGM